MTARVHRALVEIGAGLVAITALLGITDPATLNIDQVAWNWVGLVLAIAVIVANRARSIFAQ